MSHDEASTPAGDTVEANGPAAGPDTPEGSEDVAGRFDDAMAQACSIVGDAREKLEPSIEKAKSFARENPWALALAFGVIGLAVAGTLRARREA